MTKPPPFEAPPCQVPGCGQRGVYGEGVDLLAQPPRVGRWWCLAHRAGRQVERAAEAARPSGRQGELL